MNGFIIVKRNEDIQLKAFKSFLNENVFAFISFGIIAFLFLLKSPIHLWTRGITGTDSSVFKTISFMMGRGYMPYKDSFDHKGPLLYVINYLGDYISDYRGVWFFELCFMTITFFMIYKIARLSCSVVPAIISVFVTISVLFEYFDGGNYTEEYAMLFIAVSLYIFIDYFKNSRISKIRLLTCGLCLGAVLLLRPNMISVWIVFSIAVLIKLLKEKNIRQIGCFLIWFVTGLLIIVLPFIIWLACNGALEWCWRAYVEFNMEYVDAVFKDKWSAFFEFLNTSVCMTAFLFLTYICFGKRRLLDISYLVYMFVTLFFICLAGRPYEHYGMILIPAFVYPISIIFEEIGTINLKEVSIILKALVCVYFMSIVVLPNWISLISEVPTIYENRNVDQRADTVVEKVADKIMHNTTEDDTISVYGNWDIIYIASQRRHATRYSYQFPIGQVAPEVMNEYMEDLRQELPKMVVIQAGYKDDNIMEFLGDNPYELYWSENDAFIYMRK